MTTPATAAAGDGARGIDVPDARLIYDVIAGDAEAFSLLVRRHQAEMYRYARNLRLDHDTASDLVQDAFVTAYSRISTCSDPDRFRFWLLRILRNRCLDWLRDIRRKSVGLEDVTLVAQGSPHAATSDIELGETIRHALDELSPELREAFLMKHHEGRSYQEMAEIAGAGVSAMKMRVHRARETLHTLLVEAGVELPT